MKLIGVKKLLTLGLLMATINTGLIAQEPESGKIRVYYVSTGHFSEAALKEAESKVDQIFSEHLFASSNVDLITQDSYTVFYEEKKQQLSGLIREEGTETHFLPEVVLVPELQFSPEKEQVLFRFTVETAADGEILHQSPPVHLSSTSLSEYEEKLLPLVKEFLALILDERGFSVSDSLLKLATEPEGAHVFLNNAFAGTTPMEAAFSPGYYQLTLVKEGYEPEHSLLLLEPNGTKEHSLVLKVADYSDSSKYQFDYHRDYLYIPTWYAGFSVHTYFNRWAIYGFTEGWAERTDGMTGLGIEGAWFNRGFLLGAKTHLFYPEQGNPNSPLGKTFLVDLYTSPFLMAALKAGPATLLTGATFHGQWLRDQWAPTGETPEVIHVLSAGLNFTTLINFPLTPNDGFYIQLDIGLGLVLQRFKNGAVADWSGDGGLADLSSGSIGLAMGRSFF